MCNIARESKGPRKTDGSYQDVQSQMAQPVILSPLLFIDINLLRMLYNNSRLLAYPGHHWSEPFIRFVQIPAYESLTRTFGLCTVGRSINTRTMIPPFQRDPVPSIEIVTTTDATFFLPLLDSVSPAYPQLSYRCTCEFLAFLGSLASLRSTCAL